MKGRTAERREIWRRRRLKMRGGKERPEKKGGRKSRGERRRHFDYFESRLCGFPAAAQPVNCL